MESRSWELSSLSGARDTVVRYGSADVSGSRAVKRMGSGSSLPVIRPLGSTGPLGAHTHTHDNIPTCTCTDIFSHSHSLIVSVVLTLTLKPYSLPLVAYLFSTVRRRMV
jgi:hypothetical protein